MRDARQELSTRSTDTRQPGLETMSLFLRPALALDPG
jgi:hypothetical protein